MNFIKYAGSASASRVRLTGFFKQQKARIFFLEKIQPLMLAAATTAKARIKLYLGFQAVMSAGGRLLYCDTDSIFVVFKKNMTGQTFGDVYFKENDKPILIDCIFALPKSYSILAENG